jgi:hypothetical protein
LGQFSGWPTESNLSGSSMQAIHNKCYAKFVDKVRTGINLANNLAEYGQTRGLILSALQGLRNPVKVLAKKMAQYSRVNSKSLGRHLVNQVPLKDIPQALLAFRFGVQPLIQDLYDALCTYALPFVPQHYSCHSKGLWYYNKDPAGYSKWQFQTRYNGVVRMGCYLSIKDPLMNDLSKWGLLNPASVAWELTPFSFVIDWFYPVGQLISSMTDLVGLQATDTYRTWLCDGVTAVRYVGPPWDPWRRNHGYHMERTLEPSVAKIQPFRFPQNVSKTRIATALSVVLVAFKPSLALNYAKN